MDRLDGRLIRMFKLWSHTMRSHILFAGVICSLAVVGCNTRSGADANGVDPANTSVIVDRPVIGNPSPNNADINIAGPRGNGVKINVDGDRVTGDNLDVRVDTDRPLLRDSDGVDVRKRETSGSVRVDVRD
jgi:hypothetical protein